MAKTSKILVDPEKITELLTRGVAEVYEIRDQWSGIRDQTLYAEIRS